MPAELPAQVPGPVSPDDRDAWYAPTVRSQYPVGNGVVATVREDDDGFTYRTREPPLSENARRTRTHIQDRFEDGSPSRPRTREGAAARMEEGIPQHWEDHFEALADRSPAARRRLGYHLGASVRALGRLTPLALDDRIRIGDTTGECLSVHTREFAPVRTELPTDVPHLESVLSERVDTETVTFGPVSVPVTVIRRHLLGDATFDTQYAVREPDLLPGEAALVERVKARLLTSPPRDVLDGVDGAVTDRARTLLRRRMGVADSFGLRSALPDQIPLVGRMLGRSEGIRRNRETAGRIDDLVYYVLRDLVGDGPLTIPLRDPRVKRIEVNQIGERVTVVPHAGVVEDARMPANIRIDDEDAYLGLARSLAAEGGVELNVHRPSASVTVRRETTEGTRPVHCSVALPASGPERAHISIAADRPRPPSPVELVERGQIGYPLTALIWSVVEARGTVVFLGQPRAEPDAVLAAHAPFVPAADRPVAFEAPGRPVDLPQESAVTVPSEPRSGDRAQIDAGRSREALSPDVAVTTGVETPAGSERFGRLLASGRGVMASARVADRQAFTHLLGENDVSTHRLTAIDLVVELTAGPDGTATAREPVAETLDGNGQRTPTVAWNRVFAPAASGSKLVDGFVERFDADRMDPPLRSLIERRTRYLEYLAGTGETDRTALVDFLADLRTDEAATVERIQRTQRP